MTVSRARTGTECVVKNGSGIINQASINNITVTCYSQDAVAGVVTGMAANTSLVINSGNDVLTVSAGQHMCALPGLA